MPKIVLATKLKHLQATSLGCEKLHIIYGLVVLVGLPETSCEDCCLGHLGLIFWRLRLRDGEDCIKLQANLETAYWNENPQTTSLDPNALTCFYSPYLLGIPLPFTSFIGDFQLPKIETKKLKNHRPKTVECCRDEKRTTFEST